MTPKSISRSNSTHLHGRQRRTVSAHSFWAHSFSTSSFSMSLVLMLSLLVGVAGSLAAATLDSVSPERQRVHDMIELRGSGFGLYQIGVTSIVFETPDGATTVVAGRPYVWRDDYIKIRVPVGDANSQMPKTEMVVWVEAVGGTSNTHQFQLLTRPNGNLSFVQRSQIVANEDVSGFLGGKERNKARTKDADIGDINGDGYPDLIDNNSNNRDNGTHAVLRINKGDGTGFTAVDWEPVDSNDNGNFAVEIPPGGNYVGNSIVYDADFIELNNDGLVDWVQADSGSNLRLRVVMNNNNGIPGSFIEATNTWIPNQSPPGSPDDVSHTDVNYDGYLDVATSYRFSPDIDLYLNDAGTKFKPNIRIHDPSGGGSSLHDSVFIDANADGFVDIIGANESGGSPLFLHNGNLANPSFIWDQDFQDDAHSSIVADLNGDGLEDFALSEFNDMDAYLNNPANPGQFSRHALPSAASFVYDIEAVDVDLDGDIDLIGAAVTTTGDDASRIWINAGDGINWTTWVNASDILPGIGNYQRLSSDLHDFDLDGDLDFYLTGSDGSGPWGFGMSPNQFWENELLGQKLDLSGSCPGPVNVRITAATPNSRVAIFGSSTLGATALGACGGIVLDLASAQLLTTFMTDANGELDVTPDIPASACDFILQAIEADNCSVSNFASVP